MLTLIVFRHAKSDWTTDAENDHARPLNQRGIKTALKMGRWLKEQHLLPDRILCSTSKRTRQTVELAREIWTDQPPVIFSRKLYLGSHDVLTQTLRDKGGSVDTLMLVGHNPDVRDLVLELVKSRKKARDVIGKFATGSVACLACDIEAWSELSSGCAKLAAYVRPRDLG